MSVRIESHAEPIPGYRLIDRLGGGGFGEVWRAEAPGGLHKAIKFVYGDLEARDDDDGQRAEQELKALSRVKTVRHPYILSLERYDIIDGHLMIVMELADRNLWDRFKECRSQGLPGIPRDELLRYMEESAEALDLMNIEHNLQHLDIKPQNIFLVGKHIKVADFGLVKDLEGLVASVTGGVTPVYAAPETFDGYVSRFSDQYSLAIVYQELLTGRRPFTGTNVRQLVMQHVQGVPDLSPLAEDDRRILARALAKNPDERYPTCSDLVRSLCQGIRPPASCPTVITPAPAPMGGQAPSNSVTPATGPPSTVLPPRPPAGGTAAGAVLPLPVEVPPAGDRTRWLGASDHNIRLPDEPPPSPAPGALIGAGTLRPALIIGVGQVAMSILQSLRERLHERFGSLEVLPHLRLLYLDTDPDVLAAATDGATPGTLNGGEVLLARLNRASHYFKPRDGRPPISAWLDQKMLYRIPRTQTTAGIRALGRLAFCDNYRMIARRLHAELEACVGADLAAVARKTQLGYRTNRPRVYVIANLGGGTGGGMFLDLAYVLRHQLRQLGYAPPEVVGLLLLTEARRRGGHLAELANTYAALTELNHYSTPGVTFAAQYEQREKPLSDAEPPFQRCLFLSLAEGNNEADLRELASQAGDFLARDLTTPLGRAVDEGRAACQAGAAADRPAFATFGLRRLSWPRRPLVRQTARHLGQRLLIRWMSKDAAPFRDVVGPWLEEQLTGHELTPEHLIARLHEACDQQLGRRVEDQLVELAGPVEAAVGPEQASLEPALVYEWVNQVHQLLGRGDEEPAGDEPLTVQQALRGGAEALVAEWGGKLSGLAAQMIEEPEFRLAGAEEAVRQIIDRIEKTLGHYEPLIKQLTARAAEALAKIHAHMNTLQKKALPPRKAQPLVAEALELLRQYPRWRYQALVLQRAAYAYVSLRGHQSDQLREVNYCRSRLTEIRRLMEEAAIRDEQKTTLTGRSLIPGGHTRLREAVQDLLARVGPEELRDLDYKVQAMIRQQFRALMHVCLTSANMLRSFEAAVQQEVEAYVGKLLTGTNVAQLFLEMYPDEAAAQAELRAIYDAAAPDLTTGAADRFGVSVLAVPPGPEGEQVADLARQALPGVDLVTVAGTEDIVFYRERPGLQLGALEQVGPAGQNAYAQVTGHDHFTPHTRRDVSSWRPFAAD